MCVCVTTVNEKGGHELEREHRSVFGGCLVGGKGRKTGTYIIISKIKEILK